jgi:hypothetical protein
MGRHYNSSIIVADGLVLCMDAANKKSYPGSGNTWSDLTILNNNSTLTNGAVFDSIAGGAIFVDGVDDFISSVTLSALGLSNLTIQLWVRPTNIGGGNGFISVFDAASRHLSLFIGSQFYGLGATQNVYTGSFNWQNNQWVFLTMLKSGANGLVIKNNHEVVSNSFSAGSTFSNQLQFGSNPSGGGTRMTGHYGLVFLYNKALSTQEINQNYFSTYYRFRNA